MGSTPVTIKLNVKCVVPWERHEGTEGSEGMAPFILNFDRRWR